MKKLEFLIKDIGISDSPAFLEATDKELLVLMALREGEGEVMDEQICESLSISEARLHSAIEFWLRAGVIGNKNIVGEGEHGNRLIEEFDERFDPEDLDDMPLSDTAATVKELSLGELYADLAKLMGVAELSHMDVSRVAAMIKRYGVEEEYIMNLAAHMKQKGRLSVHMLGIRVKALVAKDVCTVDELNNYIASEEQERSAKYAEYRRVLGIYNRALGDSERELLDKWSDKFCFGAEIVKKAYDFAVIATGNRSFAYMDVLLTDWHSCGCRTVEECVARHEAERVRKASEREEHREAERAPRKQKKAPAPRFGNFDPEEVMKRALERTYASDESEE